MRAVFISRHGGPEVLEVRERRDPQVAPGEVRVEVRAAGINFADLLARTGMYPDAPKPPCVIGYEVAGVVESVGTGVESVAVGDRVMAATRFGGQAELCTVAERDVMPLPDRLSFEQGAAVPVNYGTAYAGLVLMGGLREGDRVLIHAAAGGVGLIASQWAKLLGLRVIGTVSTEAKAELAMASGCDEIIFYRREDVPERVRALTGGEGVTTVYDTVGKDTYEGSLKSLKRRGVLVGCGTASGPFPPIDALQLAIQGSVYFTRPALADFIANPAERAELSEALFSHVAAGRIKININQRYDLADAVQAHRDLEAGKTTGSSIFVIR